MPIQTPIFPVSSPRSQVALTVSSLCCQALAKLTAMKPGLPHRSSKGGSDF